MRWRSRQTSDAVPADCHVVQVASTRDFGAPFASVVVHARCCASIRVEPSLSRRWFVRVCAINARGSSPFAMADGAPHLLLRRPAAPTVRLVPHSRARVGAARGAEQRVVLPQRTDGCTTCAGT